MTIWAVVPAAGIGSRMQSGIPKQYLKIRGQTILELTLARLCSVAAIEHVMVVLSPRDTLWSASQIHDIDGNGFAKKIGTCIGGLDRWQSVMNGMTALSGLAADDDWILVHDAVRPCVRVSDILSLLELTTTSDVGGLLAIPVTDTLKRADSGTPGVPEVVETVSRDQMWNACTPQLFPYRLLRESLRDAAGRNFAVTDEASAIELTGRRPVLVPCSRDNIKITLAEDLALAGLILDAQTAKLGKTI